MVTYWLNLGIFGPSTALGAAMPSLIAGKVRAFGNFEGPTRPVSPVPYFFPCAFSMSGRLPTDTRVGVPPEMARFSAWVAAWVAHTQNSHAARFLSSFDALLIEMPPMPQLVPFTS